MVSMKNLTILSFVLVLISAASADEEVKERMPSGWVIAAGQEQVVAGAVNSVKEEVGGINIPSITIKGGTIQVTVNAGSDSDVFTISYNPDSNPKVNVSFEKTGIEIFAKTKDALQRKIPASLWTFVEPKLQPAVERTAGGSPDEGPGVMFWIYIAFILSAVALMIFLLYRFITKKKPA